LLAAQRREKGYAKGTSPLILVHKDSVLLWRIIVSTFRGNIVTQDGSERTPARYRCWRCCASSRPHAGLECGPYSAAIASRPLSVSLNVPGSRQSLPCAGTFRQAFFKPVDKLSVCPGLQPWPGIECETCRINRCTRVLRRRLRVGFPLCHGSVPPPVARLGKQNCAAIASAATKQTA